MLKITDILDRLRIVSRLFTLILLLSGFVNCPSAYAGEIKEIGQNEWCEFTYSGEIKTGDLAKIKSARDIHFRRYKDESGGEVADTRSICLDSVGGALQEAIAIGDYLYKTGIGTRISASDECLSACAFVFMMGVAYGGEDALVNRSMHATAKLGFHRPSINLPPLSGLTENELESAFDGAIEITSKLVELTIRQIPKTQRPMMKADLISEAFQRKGQDFFYIDTVNKAGRWEIKVDGIKPKVYKLSPEIAQNVCFNLLTWTSKNHSDRGTPEGEFSLDGVEVLHGTKGQIVFAWGQGGVSYSEGFCSVALHTNYGYPSIKVCSDEYSTLSRFTGRNCNDQNQFISSSEYLPLDLAAYPPEQNLDVLPNFDFSENLTPKNQHRFKMTCVVLSKGQIIDSETCFRELRQTSEGGQLEVYFWPSDSKTVVETNFGGTEIKVNGNKAQGEKINGFGYCLLNSRTGNYFCTK